MFYTARGMIPISFNVSMGTSWIFADDKKQNKGDLILMMKFDDEDNVIDFEFFKTET